MKETLELRFHNGEIIAEKFYFSSMNSLFDFTAKVQMLYASQFRHEANKHGMWDLRMEKYEIIAKERDDINS